MHLAYAIPDHPWVEEAGGAAVRVAMTVGAPGPGEGVLARVASEGHSPEIGYAVELEETVGVIHPDLTVGADVSSAQPLRATDGMVSFGMMLAGSGFIVTPEEAEALGLGTVPGLEAHIRPYRNGRDVTQTPRGVMLIDLFGLTPGEIRERYPAVYQHVLDHVKPERDQNRRPKLRQRWWEFGETRINWRKAVAGLTRYISTPETAKHRFFVFLEADVMPDHMLVSIASDDAYHLGVLSSRIHVVWANAAGGRLGMGNDPRYNSTRCFRPFPFPAAGPAEAEAVRALGERLDAHRQRALAAHPGLTLTALYNALDAVRAGRPLSAKEREAYDRGLVGLLAETHDALDAAVAAAYGWPPDLPEAEVLARLVALNRQRQEEEASGLVRWLRPAFQAPQAPAVQGALGVDEAAPAPAPAEGPAPWPSALPERVLAVRRALARMDRPASPSDLARRFARARTADVAQLLETLHALGQARRTEDGRFAA
jgi:hypothetical protein